MYGFLGAVNLFRGHVHGWDFHVETDRLALSHPHGFAPGAEALGYVRPHELNIETGPSADGTGIEARVERVLTLGSTTKIELSGAGRQSNQRYEVELSREQVAALRLDAGQRVRLRPERLRLFASECRPGG